MLSRFATGCSRVEWRSEFALGGQEGFGEAWAKSCRAKLAKLEESNVVCGADQQRQRCVFVVLFCFVVCFSRWASETRFLLMHATFPWCVGLRAFNIFQCYFSFKQKVV